MKVGKEYGGRNHPNNQSIQFVHLTRHLLRIDYVWVMVKMWSRFLTLMLLVGVAAIQSCNVKVVQLDVNLADGLLSLSDTTFFIERFDIEHDSKFYSIDCLERTVGDSKLFISNIDTNKYEVLNGHYLPQMLDMDSLYISVGVQKKSLNAHRLNFSEKMKKEDFGKSIVRWNDAY
jgi:hypothetical protein